VVKLKGEKGPGRNLEQVRLPYDSGGPEELLERAQEEPNGEGGKRKLPFRFR